MSFWFGDSFDLYSVLADATTFWDAGLGAATLAVSATGRFPGSRGITGAGNQASSPYLTKTSGQNDPVHHFSLAFMQTNALSGTNNGLWLTLFDSATAQCTVFFRSDGSIYLTSGASSGTVLATYTSAVAANNVWYQYEIEVVISSTAGSIAVRKNGNTVNDFFLGSLNTRVSANNYANKLGIGCAISGLGQNLDDLLWRSDATSGAGNAVWLGDIRCYTRMPASDASVHWTPSGSQVPLAGLPSGTVYSGTNGFTVNGGRYIPFVAPCTGTVASLSLQISVASTANIKACLYAASGGTVGAPIGSPSAPVSLSGFASGSQIAVPFATPPPITQGTAYYLGYITDSAPGSVVATTASTLGTVGGTALAYASWPGASPPTGLSASNTPQCTITITPTSAVNAPFVADAQQDGVATYVYSSTVGQSDLYGLASLTATPGAIVGVTTRAYMQKSDAGTRIAAVQLQSGAANVQAPLTLNTSWQWAARSDLVDPATGLGWTATGINNAQVGVTVTA